MKTGKVHVVTKKDIERSKLHKVKVSERAIIQRVNRVLIKDGEYLKKTRSARAELELGEYYIIDANRNLLRYNNIDLEGTARKMGVLKKYEVMV